MRRRDVLASGLASLSIAATKSLPAFAQGKYPEQSIKLVVPRSAGGVVDVVARLWAEQVKPQLGNVVIENQGGGGGTIGASAVARAKPDGYTLLAGTTSELVISPVIMSHPSYDPVKDLAPVAITALSISALMVHESVPAKTLAEFIAYAKANPASCPTVRPAPARRRICAPSCSSNSRACPTSCMCPTRAPIRGSRISTADICRCSPPASRRRCSTCTAGARFAFWSRAARSICRARPTFRSAREVGFPELITVQFMGVFATGGTPRPIIDQLAEVTHLAMADKELQRKLIAAGFEPVTNSGPEETAKFVREELVRWTPLLKASGIKIN